MPRLGKRMYEREQLKIIQGSYSNIYSTFIPIWLSCLSSQVRFLWTESCDCVFGGLKVILEIESLYPEWNESWASMGWKAPYQGRSHSSKATTTTPGTKALILWDMSCGLMRLKLKCFCHNDQCCIWRKRGKLARLSTPSQLGISSIMLQCFAGGGTGALHKNIWHHEERTLCMVQSWKGKCEQSGL